MSRKTVDSNQAQNQWKDLLDLALTADTDVIITRSDRPITDRLWTSLPTTIIWP